MQAQTSSENSIRNYRGGAEPMFFHKTKYMIQLESFLFLLFYFLLRPDMSYSINQQSRLNSF